MIDSPLDRSTIYLWQREDVGTIGEQGNHIAHVVWELSRQYWRHQQLAHGSGSPQFNDLGIPKILTLSAWDFKALQKIERKLEANRIARRTWIDPDFPDKGTISISTEPLEPLAIYKELFANYKLWPTVNLPQLFEKHFPDGSAGYRDFCREAMRGILVDLKLLRPLEPALASSQQPEAFPEIPKRSEGAILLTKTY